MGIQQRAQKVKWVLYLVAKAGLLRTSTSSPSWIFEALVPVPKL